MKLFLAILAGKLIAKISKFLNIGGGSAAPGLYALKIDPNLIEKLISRIKNNVIITGTNGKTTTAGMLVHLAKNSSLKVIRNHTGSNMERGITSTLIQNYGSQFDLGVWELDEFTFNSVATKLKPNIVIFLNISRDQLDRYGEIDQVVNRWCDTISRLDPKTTVLINADDPNLLKLEKYFKGRIIKFGRKNVKNIKERGLAGSSFEFLIADCQLPINIPLPGLYNIYNALTALIIAHHLGLSSQKSLHDFQPAFGRVEKLDFGYIFLIKNPVGATRVFETIAPILKAEDRILFVLNDNLADGRDISWIWDVEFEPLCHPERLAKDLRIYVSGTRAYELAVRLKYAGFDPKQITVIEELENALKEARKGLKGKLYILPTYTAMLHLQKILTKQGVKPHYWKEGN